MRNSSFRFCMLVGSLALLGVSIYYFSEYFIVLRIALRNSGVQPDIQDSVRALWLSFASQGLLIGLLYLLVVYRPHAVTREAIVLLGLIQLVEAVLLFTFSGSKNLALVLVVAATFVMIGALLWPRKMPREDSEEPEPADESAAPGPDES